VFFEFDRGLQICRKKNKLSYLALEVTDLKITRS